MNNLVTCQENSNGSVKKNLGWFDYGRELVPFYQSLLVRNDAHGTYWRDRKTKQIHTTTKKEQLTAEHINCHLMGLPYPKGIHTIRPADSMCRINFWDIDKHDQGKSIHADPTANLNYALHLCSKLDALRIAYRLFDSNGKGGYHLWVIWKDFAPAHLIKSFGDWMVRDWEKFPGIDLAESFPKQDCLTEHKQFGNWIRLPGRHHTRDHWHKVWDGQRWLEGEDCVRYWLAYQNHFPDTWQIPQEASIFVAQQTTRNREERKRIAATWDGEYNQVEWWKNYNGKFTTLDLVGLFKEHGLLISSGDNHQHLVTCPWHEEHSSQSTGTAIWNTPGEWPGFNCLHAHCQGRGLEDVLAWFGKEEVEKYFGQKFQEGNGHEELDYEAIAGIIRPWDSNGLEDLHSEPDEPDLNGDQPEPGELDAEPDVVDVDQPEPGEIDAEPEADEPPTGPEYVADEQPRSQQVAKKPLIRAMSIEAIENMPLPVWQIKEHLTTGSLGIMYGDFGTCKSFLALDMMLSVANGLPYLQRWPTKQGKVVYALGEGVAFLKNRIAAWHSLRGIKTPNEQFALIPDIVPLAEEGIPEEIIKVVLAYFNGQKPDLLFIDTFARFGGGLDENNPKDMGKFLDAITKVGQALGCTVGIVHHCGKDPSRGPRGHNKLPCACDWMIEVSGGPEGVSVRCAKQKDHEEFERYLCQAIKSEESICLEYVCPANDTVLADKHDQEKARLFSVIRYIAPEGSSTQDLLTNERIQLKKTAVNSILAEAAAKGFVKIDKMGKMNKHWLTDLGQSLLNECETRELVAG